MASPGNRCCAICIAHFRSLLMPMMRLCVCVCVWYIGASTQLRVCSTVGIVAGVFGLVISVVLAIIIAYLW